MKISAETRISELIKANKESIDVIASINKHFEKLRNPFLRKILAPRVTIADAAKIGGVSLSEFFSRLQAIGFQCEGNYSTIKEETSSSKIITRFSSELDVRPAISSGQDPFNAIMASVKELKGDDVLKIINSFEPIPLIRILEKNGYNVRTERHSPDCVFTFVQAKNVSEKTETPGPLMVSGQEFGKLLLSYGEKVHTVDVRDLEMPLPMVTILSEAEELPEGFVLLVEHKKIPVYLIPELSEKNFRMIFQKISEGHIRMLIYK